MPLTSGSRLGPYQIVAPLGEGGMGAVYRAIDTSLSRQVAVKVLLDAVAADADRLARLEREAKTLALLNHPSIAAIYGLERSGGQIALVMELVEGPTLAERIAQGPVPFAEALPMAKQIAEALEAAHEQGIVHRDLKPANVKIRDDGTVKVLDFGLAKAIDPMSTASSASMSPTITSPAMTRAGMILGTASYMSPEQARGRPVDKRSDIWSFGCVLYEMLTGLRPFPGDDVAETLAAVIKTDPDFSVIPATVPPGVVAVIRRCLQRDRHQRVHDIGDVRLALDGAFDAPAQTALARAVAARSPWLQPLVLLAIVGALAAGVAAGRYGLHPGGTPVVPTHVALSVPFTDRFLSNRQSIAVAPDGAIVYSATRGGVQQLFRRSINEVAPAPIPGTEGGDVPFFSPDGQWLGFVANRFALRKVTLQGGEPTTITSFQYGITEAVWGKDGTIVFATEISGDSLHAVPASGGDVRRATKAAQRAGTTEYSPDLLPNGRGMLFNRNNDVVAVNADGEEKVLVNDASWAHVVPTGHLLFWRSNSIFAVPFDLASLTVKGDPVPLVAGVNPRPAVDDRGTLAYSSGETIVGRTLEWVDRSGHAEPLPLAMCECQDPALSPDGSRIALSVRAANNSDIFVYDRTRGSWNQLTVNANAFHPSWSPDGRKVGFLGRAGKGFSVRAADGTGPVETLVTGTDPLFEAGWTPDGRSVLAVPVSPQTSGDIVVASVEHPGAVTTLIQGPQFDYEPHVSPNGRWIVYGSVESGHPEVYVRPYPNVKDGSWKISTNGGLDPRWSAKGDEIFYTNYGSMMAVPVDAGVHFSNGVPHELFTGDYLWSRGRRCYDVAPDGRFLMLRQVRGDVTIQLSLNWFDELKARVPIH